MDIRALTFTMLPGAGLMDFGLRRITVRRGVAVGLVAILCLLHAGPLPPFEPSRSPSSSTAILPLPPSSHPDPTASRPLFTDPDPPAEASLYRSPPPRSI